MIGLLALLAAPPALGAPDDLKPGEMRVRAEGVPDQPAIAVTSDGRTYLAEPFAGGLAILNANGEWLEVAPDLYPRAGENKVGAIAAGPDGALYISADDGVRRMAQDGRPPLRPASHHRAA